MSGSILTTIFPWLAQLQQASFRGTPFYVDDHSLDGGRRAAVHEFPLRDDAYVEDLGRNKQQHRIRAYVYGSDYMSQRDALIEACQGQSGPGTLIHPYLGQKTGIMTGVKVTEGKNEAGIAHFDLTFVESGAQASPVSGDDTASALLSGIVSMLPKIIAAYTLVSVIAKNPALLGGLAESLLGQAAGALIGNLTGLSSSVIASIAANASLFLTAPSTDSITATSVTGALSSIGDQIVAAVPVTDTTDDPVAGTVPVVPATDPSYGLAAFASWGSALPAQMSGLQQADRAAVQANVVALVQGSAVSALAQVYAQTDFPYAQAATAARAQLFGLIDGQAVAAADAGQDALYLAWRALGSLAIADLTQRAQGLPSLATYSVPVTLPASTLAQRLYQDGTQAAALATLNGVRHPLFMPTSGQYLQ